MRPAWTSRKASNVAKSWNWSYSKLKNYETCPRRHYEIDVAKNYVEKKEPGGPLDWGDKVHDAMKRALTGQAPVAPDGSGIVVGAPGTLPPEMSSYQPWIERVKRGPGTLLVEQKYAITADFKATQYFANNVWLRSIGDVVRVHGDVGLTIDWKTGRRKEDSVQLLLVAQCLFSFYPLLKVVRSEFVWLQEDSFEEGRSTEIVTRQSLALAWVGILDRVAALEEANKALAFPPKPGALCQKYCAVTSCPFHGKDGRR